MEDTKDAEENQWPEAIEPWAAIEASYYRKRGKAAAGYHQYRVQVPCPRIMSTHHVHAPRPRVTSMKIDLFEFARLGGEAFGELGLAEMRRVETPERTGTVTWKAAGATGARHGTPQLDLEIDGRIELICQRCLQSMRHEVAIRSHFLIVLDEESAIALDDDDAYDVIVGAADFELDTLVEDEVILALPIAPRHEVCPDDHANLPYRDEKPSPFAALASLRTDPRDKVGGGR